MKKSRKIRSNQIFKPQRFIYLNTGNLEILSSIRSEIDRYNWVPENVDPAEEARFLSKIDEINTKFSTLKNKNAEIENLSDEDPTFATLDAEIRSLEASIQADIDDLNTIAPDFQNEIKKFFELLHCSNTMGFDLLRVNNLVLPDGKEIEIQNINYIPILDSERNINNYAVEIEIKHEDEADSQVLTTRSLKQLMEQNSISPVIENKDILNTSNFIQAEDFQAGQKFSKLVFDNPETFEILEINDDSIKISKPLNPFLQGDNSSDTMSFGDFISLINNHEYRPAEIVEQLTEANREIEELQEDVNEQSKRAQALEFADTEEIEEISPTTTITPKESYVHRLKSRSVMLSGNNIWNSIKTAWEQLNGKWQLMDNLREGKFGEATFSGALKEHYKQSKRKASERQIIEGLQKELSSKHAEFLKKRLRISKNKYELEVCFDLLAEKGLIDFWDRGLWENIFKIRGGPYVLPDTIDPSKKESIAAYLAFQKAINGKTLWDDPTQFNKWNRTNLSNCNSKVSDRLDSANLKISTRGFAKTMEEMLIDHRKSKGETVIDSHEYEALLLYAMENGKGTIEEKIYYLIQGLTLKNQEGNSVLSMERLSQMKTKLSSKYLPLNFLTQSLPRKPEGKEHVVTKQELERFQKEFDRVNGEGVYQPNKAVKDFIWNTMMTNKEYRSLASDQVRNLNTVESTESQYYIPLATESLIKNSLQAYGGMKMTMDGFANGFAGFNQYIKVLTQSAVSAQNTAKSSLNQKEASAANTTYNDLLQNLKEAIKAHTFYDAILNEKYEERPINFIRMDANARTNILVADTKNYADYYINETNGLTLAILEAYKDQNTAFYDAVFPLFDPDENSTTEQTKAWNAFRKGFDELVNKDKCEKMLSVLSNSKITGIDR